MRQSPVSASGSVPAPALPAELASGDAEQELPRLLGAALAGLALAAGAALLVGARGDWTAGLVLAGGILLLTAATLLLLIRPRRMADSRRALLDALAGLALPAALTRDDGALVAANAAYRSCFGIRPPTSLVPDVRAGDLLDDADARSEIARATIGDRSWRVHLASPRGGGRLWIFEESGTATAATDHPDADSEALLWLMLHGLSAIEIGCAILSAHGEIFESNECFTDWLGVQDPSAIPDDLRRRLLEDMRTEIEIGDVSLRKHVLDGPDDRRLLLLYPPSPAADTGTIDVALLESLFAAAPVGLAIVDKEGRLVEFNAAFEQFAPNHAPARGEVLADYVAQDDRAEVESRLEQAFSSSPPRGSVELGFNTQPPRNGRIFISPLPDREPRTALVHLIDTTQHRSLERQFVQAQKMQAVGQLAGGVAHDFNNLLTAIIGFCDLLLVRHGPGDQSFADVMQIKQNANRAANLVRQLLAFSRQQTMRPKLLVVTDVLADLSNMLRRLIGERIELKMIHGRDLGAVKVDQGQLEQVIINLAVNARDAMPDGGTLTIRTKAVGPGDRLVRHYSVMPAGDYVLIEISDDGEGIPPENLNKIFEPFFTTKSVGRGTGLGLSTVYGIIKQTGGFIFVESTPGEGSVFRVYLPVHERTPDEEAAAPDETPADLTGHATILLVEDEEAVRMFAARALANKGYKVLEAASGEDALALMREADGGIDLLISDVVMPNMDGPALVTEARKLQPGLRIVFISGYAEEVFKTGLGDSAADFVFLPKPFSLRQLAETVKRVLDQEAPT